MMHTEIGGHEWVLHPHKAVYLPALKILLIADLHLGKVNHFRKSGIPVPQAANDKNTEHLIDLLNQVKPERVILLGDLFHSHYNPEWEVFGQIRKHFSNVSFELVPGNHDIMSTYQYEKHEILLHDKQLILDNLFLTHEPLENVPPNQFNISAHIHPGVRLNGKGRQSITLPCFYFTEQQAVLPAFGLFTGLFCVNPKKKDKVFVIVDDKVMEIA